MDPYPGLAPLDGAPQAAPPMTYAEQAYLATGGNTTAWEVKAFVQHITKVIKADICQDYWICAELIDVKVNGSQLSGKLRDKEGYVLPFFSYQVGRDFLREGLKNGDPAMVRGCISVNAYFKTAQLQFLVKEIHRLETEAETLEKLFRKNLAQLSAEGACDQTRKKPIPCYPKCIGVVSSIGCAGYRDFLNHCRERVPGLHFVVANTRVQGNGAAQEIATAMKLLDDSGACDVIVIARGGGDANDLWCFNEIELARAIVAAKTPILTAIGHERDTSLVDYVADCYAITPTAAAEAITKHYYDAIRTLRQSSQRLMQAIAYRAQNARMRLESCRRARYLRQPELLIQERKSALSALEQVLLTALPNRASAARMRLEGLMHRLEQQRRTLLQSRKEVLARLQSTLRALDPKGVLQRGYSILLDESNRAVRRAEEAPAGTRLTALLGDGTLILHVEK